MPVGLNFTIKMLEFYFKSASDIPGIADVSKE